ncbi:hypothetical protein [Actinokineospora sp. HUAS TT18]
MSELTTEELDQIIASLEQLEADVSATIDQLHSAGFSADEQPPAQT